MGSLSTGDGVCPLWGRPFSFVNSKVCVTMSNSFPPLKTIAISHPVARISFDLTHAASAIGYDVVATTARFEEITHIAQSLKPHLILMHMGLLESTLCQAVLQVVAMRTTGVIALFNEHDTMLALQSMNLGTSGYMVYPYDDRQIRVVLESSWHHFHSINALQENLELRTLMDKAKGVLMEQQGISENQAHHTILRMSQNQGISLKELCHSIVQVKPILVDEKLRKS
jgi:AmiR/NasT family two-component response regulator